MLGPWDLLGFVIDDRVPSLIGDGCDVACAGGRILVMETMADDTAMGPRRERRVVGLVRR